MHSDLEIIEVYKSSKSKALEYLYTDYRNTLYVCALSILGEEHAEDFIQDFFISFVYGKNDKPSGFSKYRLEHNCSLGQFMKVCLKNKCISKLRLLKSRSEKQIRYADPEDEDSWDSMKSEISAIITAILDRPQDDMPDKIIEREDLMQNIKGLVNQLDIRCQKVIQYYYDQDLSQEATARILGMTTGGISANIFRCIKQLKNLVYRKFLTLSYDY